QAVFGAVLFAGIIFLLLTFTSLRELLIAAIPAPLKVGITAGIGLFIAFLGLRSSGIVVENPETFVALGDVTSPVTLLSIVGLFWFYVNCWGEIKVLTPNYYLVWFSFRR